MPSNPTHRARRSILTRALTWTNALCLAFGLGLIATLMPLGGRWVWWLDLASHARLQAFLGFATVTLMALGTRRFGIGAASLGMTLFHGLALWPYYASVPSPHEQESSPESSLESTPSLRLVVANVLTTNPNHKAFLDWVRAQDPDVLALLEIGAGWHQTLQRELKAWPHEETLVREDNFGMAIYSRVPIETLQWMPVLPGGPVNALVQLQWEGRSVPLLLTHPIPPVAGWASRQRDQQIAGLARVSVLQEDLALLVGDLNATPWSKAFTPLRQTPLRDGRLGFGYLGTWPAWAPALLRIPIDHVWLGPGWQVTSFETGPQVGSDHLPLFATLQPRTMR